MSEIPAVLRVREAEPGRWVCPNPEGDPEGRDVIFSGQILAQMIMAASAAGAGEKEVKSVHAIFARTGRYSSGQMEMGVESMHSGRAWASSTVTATQADRLLSRGLVLMSSIEDDLIRHSPAMPDVPGPGESAAQAVSVAFPGAEVRMVEAPEAVTDDGSPVISFWMRIPGGFDSPAADQAALAWSQPGLIIGAAMRPHSDVVSVSDAHRSISTGVISHTAHFHERFDVTDWLLVTNEGSYAGNGRIFGKGAVFTRGGTLVSTFAQDSMARRVDGELSGRGAM